VRRAYASAPQAATLLIFRRASAMMPLIYMPYIALRHRDTIAGSFTLPLASLRRVFIIAAAVDSMPPLYIYCHVYYAAAATLRH